MRGGLEWGGGGNEKRLDGMGGQMLLPEYQSSDSNPQLLDPDSSFLTTRPHRHLQ